MKSNSFALLSFAFILFTLFFCFVESSPRHKIELGDRGQYQFQIGGLTKTESHFLFTSKPSTITIRPLFCFPEDVIIEAAIFVNRGGKWFSYGTQQFVWSNDHQMSIKRIPLPNWKELASLSSGEIRIEFTNLSTKTSSSISFFASNKGSKKATEELIAKKLKANPSSYNIISNNNTINNNLYDHSLSQLRNELNNEEEFSYDPDFINEFLDNSNDINFEEFLQEYEHFYHSMYDSIANSQPIKKQTFENHFHFNEEEKKEKEELEGPPHKKTRNSVSQEPEKDDEEEEIKYPSNVGKEEEDSPTQFVPHEEDFPNFEGENEVPFYHFQLEFPQSELPDLSNYFIFSGFAGQAIPYSILIILQLLFGYPRKSKLDLLSKLFSSSISKVEDENEEEVLESDMLPQLDDILPIFPVAN